MDSLKPEVKKEIVLQKLEAWKQRTYSLELDAKVANVTNDSQMLDSVKVQLKTALGALELLKEELDKLEENAV